MEKDRALFWGIAGTKIILLALFVLFFGTSALVWSDSTTFLRLGRGIFMGQGFVYTQEGSLEFIPATTRTPLYSVFIGFFDVFVPYGRIAVSIIQAFVAAANAYFVFKIARMFLPEKWALAGAILFSFEPLVAVTNMLILPETILTFFILIFAYFFLLFMQDGRRSLLVYSALALALAVYTKPVAYYLFIIPLAVLVIKRRFYAVGIFAGILFLLFLPWMVRNYGLVGSFSMTTNDSGNICSWELVGVLATKYRIDSSDFTTLYALPEYAEVYARCTGSFSALSIFMTEYRKEFFITSALGTLAFLTNDGYSAFFEKSSEEQVKIHHNYLTPAVFTNADWWSKIKGAFFELELYERIVVLGGKIFRVLIFFFMIFCILTKRSEEVRFLVFIIFYFLAVSVVSTGYGVGARLRIPVDSFLILLAFSGFQQLFHRLRI